MTSLKDKYFRYVSSMSTSTTKKYTRVSQVGRQIQKDLKNREIIQKKTGLTDDEVRDLLKNMWSEPTYEKYKDKLAKLDEHLLSTKIVQLIKEITDEESVLASFKEKANAAMFELFRQAKAGYGKGNAISHLAEIITNSLGGNTNDIHFLCQMLQKQ